MASSVATSRGVASRARRRSRAPTQANIQAGEMGGLAALSQQGGGKATRPSQGWCCSGSMALPASSAMAAASVAGRLRVSPAPGATPRPCILVPVGIIGQRILAALPRLAAGDGLIGACHCGVDGGQRLGEQRIVAILDDVRREVRVNGVTLHRERLRRVGVLALPCPPAKPAQARG